MGAIHRAGNAALLRFLLRAKVITPEAGQRGDAELPQADAPTAAIDWLVANEFATEPAIAAALARELQLPFANVAATALRSEVIATVREDLCAQHQVVPLRLDSGTLVVAASNPLDRAALRAIEFATGKRVQVEVATPTAIRDALEHAYHLDDSLDAYLRGIPDGPDLPVAEFKEPTKDMHTLMRDTNLAPVVKLLNSIVMEGLRTRASDIHIETGASAVRVRYRIDGLLEEAVRLPKWLQDPLIARCKVLARLDITERRVPQDGRIHVQYRNALVDLRVSCLPTQFGEKVTIRILDATSAPRGLEELSFSPDDLQHIRQAITRPEGMILVTGPTGSGKTTTLYGMLAEIVSPRRNVVTIENPIEYQIDGISQIDINEKQGLTFASTLRSILRQDPDVILVGEIRDAETAQIAMRAAQTGHLVLSTLHTNDATATITRLLDLGIEPYLIASSVHLVMAQRLVRRVCEQCGVPDTPAPELLQWLHIDPSDPNVNLRRGGGCPGCRQSGCTGRIGVFEVVPISAQLAKLIESKAPESALRMQARMEGTRFLPEQVSERVRRGVASADEAVRVVDLGPESKNCTNCARVVDGTFALCPYCGTILRSNCMQCGTPLQHDWQLCPFCGTSKPQGRAGATAPEPMPATAEPTPAPAASREIYRVLTVDDHAEMRRLITLVLQRSGLPIEIEAVSSGAEALVHAQQHPPELVVLDLMMPEMDGFEVCRQLRANVRTAFVPILMLTAHDSSENRVRGFLTGTDDFVAKPFARAELIARVRRLLERSYGVTLASEPARAGEPLELMQ